MFIWAYSSACHIFFLHLGPWHNDDIMITSHLCSQIIVRSMMQLILFILSHCFIWFHDNERKCEYLHTRQTAKPLRLKGKMQAKWRCQLYKKTVPFVRMVLFYDVRVSNIWIIKSTKLTRLTYSTSYCDALHAFSTLHSWVKYKNFQQLHL